MLLNLLQDPNTYGSVPKLLSNKLRNNRFWDITITHIVCLYIEILVAYFLNVFVLYLLIINNKTYNF